MKKLLHGDVIKKLRTLKDNSVDSVVTDPPYELGFMGEAWDSKGIAYNVEMWNEVLRVLKPGGYLLAFGGSRTYHRMACAVEDAGFEVRDQIMWVYGSGFPKSTSVSKAMDKSRVEDLEPVRGICRAIRTAMDAGGYKSRDLTQYFSNCNARLIDHWAARDTDSQPSLPTWDQWETLRDGLDIGHKYDAEVRRLNDRKGTAGDTWNSAAVVGEHKPMSMRLGGHKFSVRDSKIRRPSAASEQWAGWSTALKPAHEPILVARKLLIGTVAQNVQQHGTGALNIDGCRVTVDGARPSRVAYRRSGNVVYGDGLQGSRADGHTTRGRWPANLIHDGSDEVTSLFPDKAGAAAPVKGTEASAATKNAYGEYGRTQGAFHGDTGSAARFFYCAKASRADRGTGNTHPTVKPTDLMRYLCRLVTQPKGIVLDPFMGSGSTGKAALLEGFSFIGIDQDKAYCRIAETRITTPRRK